MIFSDYMNSVALRMRETEALTNTRLTVQTPYFVANDLQYIVYNALIQTMREIPKEDFEGFDGIAVKTLDTASASPYNGVKQIAAPINFARVIGVSVDGKSTESSSVASFVQALNMTGSRWTNRWTMVGGQFLFIGTTAIFTVLVEPPLADWLSQVPGDPPIMPPGYDIRAVDLAHKRVLIADYVPAWRP